MPLWRGKMQYLYSEEAGAPQLDLLGDPHRYLFKVRRHRSGDSIHMRNLREQILYRYRIEAIDRKRASLILEEQHELRVAAERTLHLGWCLVDPKTIEKTLPSLNETGVERITFIYCDRSQRSFRLDYRRLEKILLNSSQQCGRSVMMKLDEAESLKEFLDSFPESWMLNFSEKKLGENRDEIGTLLIGAEGGFTREESLLVDPGRVVGLDTSLILRSETAVCAAAGKILL